MLRREFTKNILLASGTLAIAPKIFANSIRGEKNIPLINSYYFRAHSYTMVPHQVREDMQWMADLGTDVVSIAILEQDTYAAVDNIRIICEEANKVGLKVFAVPSRIGGLVAGAPKVPSMFSVQNPDTWILDKDGKPHKSWTSGVISSIHHPATVNFVIDFIDKVFQTWDISGIIWDEPKSLFVEDFSTMAIKNLGKEAPMEKHTQAVCDFFSDMNEHIKSKYKNKTTNLFAYAHLEDIYIDMAAEIKFLDYFGCDGRPWKKADFPEKTEKVLLGKDAGERYIEAARNHNKKSLMLIENHALTKEESRVMDKNLDQILNLDLDQVIYYYYPRSLEDPEYTMDIIRKQINKRYKKFKPASL